MNQLSSSIDEWQETSNNRIPFEGISASESLAEFKCVMSDEGILNLKEVVMGAYINPEGESKEDFLAREGEPSSIMNFDDVPEGKLPVIHCNNGAFTAAGICYSEDEFKAFTDPKDIRPKSMFLVDIEKLHKVSPELRSYMAT